MTPRFKSLLVLVTYIASAVFFLGGCATLSSSDRQSEQDNTSALTSLRISDTENIAERNQKFSPPARSGESTRSNSSLPAVEIAAPDDIPQTIDLTRETDDLFQRMRNGFSMPDIHSDLVLYHQQWYLNRPDYLRRIVERSSRYMHHIVEELEKRGMPLELALLPMVESAYNPMAYSRSKASGLWQFIPATGKRYNLDQNWWIDERRDIVASTAAALDYLQTIYEMHGDWHLALASYNWGEGAVGRAIGKNRNQGLPTDYLSLTMPAETKNYVPKLQALKNIFSNPAIVVELDLPKILNRPYFGTVTKTTNIDVKLAAQLADMPIEDFVALNPANNRPVIMSDTPMVIPSDKLDTFMNNLEAHEDSNKPLSLWQSYTVRPGDRLEKIAPRFGMTVTNLKAVNGIRGRIKINPGFTLLVPGQSGSETLDKAELKEQLRQQPDSALASSVAEPANAVENSRTTIARKGDTLITIAKRYGTSVAELKRINKLRNNKIAVGTRLALAQAKTENNTSAKEAKKSTSDKKPATVTKQANAKKTTKITRYTIRRGDTLTSIARQFKVDADDILRWNRIQKNILTPGKTLTIQLAQNP